VNVCRWPGRRTGTPACLLSPPRVNVCEMDLQLCRTGSVKCDAAARAGFVRLSTRAVSSRVDEKAVFWPLGSSPVEEEAAGRRKSTPAHCPPTARLEEMKHA